MLVADGQPVESGGIGTMSKSKNNGVDPQALIEEYGADIARFFMMFASPPEDTLMWKDAGVEGASRFLRRAMDVRLTSSRSGRALPRRSAATTLRAGARRGAPRGPRAAEAGELRHGAAPVQHGGTAGMKILNALEARAEERRDGRCARTVAARGLQHPAAAARADHAARRATSCGATRATATTSSMRRGPSTIRAALVQDEVELVVQVNGKKRGDMRVPREAERSSRSKRSCSPTRRCRSSSSGQPVKKVVVVPGRLVNVVV